MANKYISKSKLIII